MSITDLDNDGMAQVITRMVERYGLERTMEAVVAAVTTMEVRQRVQHGPHAEVYWLAKAMLQPVAQLAKMHDV